MVSRRDGPSLDRILRLVEMELIRKLRRELKQLPQEKRVEHPYQGWLEESEHRLNVLSENHEEPSG